VDEFTPWKQTRHATILTRGMDGHEGPYSSTCVECHSVGFDPEVASSGFDEAAARAGWTLPEPKSSNWSDMWSSAPDAARLANVQCESCHGPQGGYNVDGAHGRRRFRTSTARSSRRGSFAAEACAVCHGQGGYHVYSEWATRREDGVGHSSRAAAAVGAGATGLSTSCGRCHAAQGYTLYARLLKQGKIALNTVDSATLATVTSANVEAVTCVACHDPHDATNPDQLRFMAIPPCPVRVRRLRAGKGAVCITCHNSRNAAQIGSDSLTYLHEDGQAYNAGNPTGHSTPHVAAQVTCSSGGTRTLGASLPMTSDHAAVEDTCVSATWRSSRRRGCRAAHRFRRSTSSASIRRTCARSAPTATEAP
jgi:hypothetical protein